MGLGYDRDLYLLAFDHRGSFQKQLFGIGGTPNAAEAARIADAKAVIFDGFVVATKARGLRDDMGILTDEEFGAPLARRAHEMGAVLAMPAEASGRAEFDFEYGDDFGAHIEAFDPTFTKVLVRYNPEGEDAVNRRQLEKLKRLGDWLHERGRRFLFELLVPATEKQLLAVDHDADVYDREVRPGLVLQTIVDCQQRGVEADVWKIEGLDARSDCERVAAQARAGGRSGVICIVLGRGANTERVDHWLRAGSGVPGYRGFAIGRTLWWDALVGWRDGKLTREQAAQTIGDAYLHAIDVYTG